MSIFTSKAPALAQDRQHDRRSFLQKLGFGVSTTLGSSLVVARPVTDNALSLELARLEAEKALRVLHQQYEQAMDAAQMDSVLSLFGDDAEVVFNGGVFRGREQGISRLYRRHFAPVHAGKRMEAAPGFELTAEQGRQQVDVAADMRSARAVLPYSIQVGKTMEPTSSLISMALSQGEGVHTWWEGGLYEVSYSREVKNGRWLIERLIYNTLSRADYRAGRSYAKALRVAAFAKCFAEDGIGPDALV